MAMDRAILSTPEEAGYGETMTSDEKQACEMCGAVGQHWTSECPYFQHSVSMDVLELRKKSPTGDTLFLLNEMDRWAARWIVARDALVSAQERVSDALDIRTIADDNGCENCSHFWSRKNTCVPTRGEPRLVNAGDYVPPWCPGFNNRMMETSDETTSD